MQRVQRSTLLTAAILAGCAVAGAANAQVIRITNVNSPTGHDIPLKANSSVQIDSAGNLLAECALNANNQCAQLGSGGASPNAPTATLTRLDTNQSLTVGQSMRLGWSSTNAEACKVSSTGPGTTGFNGVRATASSNGENLTVSAVGNFTFSLVCYNAAGASTAATVSVSVAAAPGGGSGGGENCNINSEDPNFNPRDFSPVDKSWTTVFSSPDGSPSATYPHAVSFPTPVPRISKGTYAVVEFTPVANQSVNLYWDQVQARSQDGYSQSRPAENMFFAISPCRGDLRMWQAGSTDPYLRPGCRKFANSASLVWSSGPLITQSDESVCFVNAGQKYYLHIVPANPEGGLDPGEHSCEPTPNTVNGCDVGVRIGVGPG